MIDINYAHITHVYRFPQTSFCKLCGKIADRYSYLWIDDNHIDYNICWGCIRKFGLTGMIKELIKKVTIGEYIVGMQCYTVPSTSDIQFYGKLVENKWQWNI